MTDEQKRLEIKTRCLSCGNETLFVNDFGEITCSWLGCKQPMANLQKRLEEMLHIIRNPYGHPDQAVRQARLDAADYIERQMKITYCATDKSQAELMAIIDRQQAEIERLRMQLNNNCLQRDALQLDHAVAKAELATLKQRIAELEK